LPMHSHEHAHFCLVLDGAYIERIGHQQLERRKYTLVFHPGELPHSEHTSEEGRQFIVDVDPSYLDRCAIYARRLDKPLHAAAGGAIVWLARKLYGEFRCMDSVSPLAMEGMLLELFSELARQTESCTGNTRQKWILQLDDLLRDRFRQPLNLRQLAAEVNVSPAHLSRVFRKFQGCTVGEYVRQLRITWASQKLLDKSVSLAELSTEAGFFDQSHFTRAFKRLTGRTPSEFRSRKH